MSASPRLFTAVVVDLYACSQSLNESTPLQFILPTILQGPYALRPSPLRPSYDPSTKALLSGTRPSRVVYPLPSVYIMYTPSEDTPCPPRVVMLTPNRYYENSKHGRSPLPYSTPNPLLDSPPPPIALYV